MDRVTLLYTVKPLILAALILAIKSFEKIILAPLIFACWILLEIPVY